MTFKYRTGDDFDNYNYNKEDHMFVNWRLVLIK